MYTFAITENQLKTRIGTTFCSLEVGLGFKVLSGLGLRDRERERARESIIEAC